MIEPPTPGELRDHLVRARIAGDVATSRQDNLAKYAMFAARVPMAMFGLRPQRRWRMRDVIDLMARRCGVSPDLRHLRGPDRIDPGLTVAALDAMAAHVARVAHPGARVVIATGHPAGLLPVHLAIAAALQAAGAEVLTPAAGWTYRTPGRDGRARRQVRYVDGVAMVSDKGELKHSHSAKPMVQMLSELTMTSQGPPDLVVADHGFAGAAGAAGVTAVGFADSNDPALFVGAEEGRVAAVVPLDDNVAPHLYAPLTAYLLGAAGLPTNPARSVRRD